MKGVTMHTEYNIRTLRDIFDLPQDKMDRCLAEVTAGMIQAKQLQQAISSISGGIASMEWPEESTWIDDDKGEITSNVCINNQPAFSVTSKQA